MFPIFASGLRFKKPSDNGKLITAGFAIFSFIKNRQIEERDQNIEEFDEPIIYPNNAKEKRDQIAQNF